MPLSDAELTGALEVALRAAHVVSTIIDCAMEERESTLFDINFKGNSCDLVTQFDQQCEEEALAVLRSGTPHFEIISEETRSAAPLGDRPTWILDPIDGTTSFVHGLFDCCVSIALVVDRQPVLGAVAAPALHEVYSAVAGRGAFCNGQRIRVSKRRRLQEAVVYMHQAYNRHPTCVDSIIGMQKELMRTPVHALRSQGSAALDMCFVASGKAELYLEAGIHPWDVAAGAIIVREAGGVVHDVDNTDSFDLTSRGVCCANSIDLGKAGVELSKKYNYKASVLNSVA